MTFVLPHTSDPSTTPVTRRNNMVGMEHILDLIENYIPASKRVRSFDNTHAPITQQSIETLARNNKLQTERVYDAAHGGRYLLFVYPRDDEYVGSRPNPHRVACFDFLCKPLLP